MQAIITHLDYNALISLLWPSVVAGIQFEALLLTDRMFNSTAPSYVKRPHPTSIVRLVHCALWSSLYTTAKKLLFAFGPVTVEEATQLQIVTILKKVEYTTLWQLLK